MVIEILTIVTLALITITLYLYTTKYQQVADTMIAMESVLTKTKRNEIIPDDKKEDFTATTLAPSFVLKTFGEIISLTKKEKNAMMFWVPFARIAIFTVSLLAFAVIFDFYSLSIGALTAGVVATLIVKHLTRAPSLRQVTLALLYMTLSQSIQVRYQISADITSINEQIEEITNTDEENLNETQILFVHDKLKEIAEYQYVIAQAQNAEEIIAQSIFKLVGFNPGDAINNDPQQ